MRMRTHDLYILTASMFITGMKGGTGLATQRECLEILGCSGKDKALKFSEIVAATVISGELSLGAAIMSGDWVSSHEKLGRNR